MWMDIQSTCNEQGACDITLKRGLQYAVVLQEVATKLSKLVPFSSFKECPVSDNKARFSMLVSLDDSMQDTRETSFLETAVEDWNMDSIVNVSTEQALSQETTQFYGDRILLRPKGVANAGCIVTRIGSSLECPATVQVVEILPPFIRPLWDTWTLTEKPLLSALPDGSIMVQWNMTVSRDTELQVTLDYEPVLVPFQQFPADPNRGIELPPTQFIFEAECTLGSTKLYSSPLLLMPPVPDMSMPFNVISLTCTLYAFVIGSLANLLVRRASQRIKTKLYPEENKSKLQKLKERLGKKLFKKKGEEVNSKGPNDANGVDKVSPVDDSSTKGNANEETAKESTTDESADPTQ
jgi:phosphatidylinositol glycan class T